MRVMAIILGVMCSTQTSSATLQDICDFIRTHVPKNPWIQVKQEEQAPLQETPVIVPPEPSGTFIDMFILYETEEARREEPHIIEWDGLIKNEIDLQHALSMFWHMTEAARAQHRIYEYFHHVSQKFLLLLHTFKQSHSTILDSAVNKRKITEIPDAPKQKMLKVIGNLLEKDTHVYDTVLEEKQAQKIIERAWNIFRNIEELKKQALLHLTKILHNQEKLKEKMKEYIEKCKSGQS